MYRVIIRHPAIAFAICALLLASYGNTALAGQGSFSSRLGSSPVEEAGPGEMLFDLFAVRPVGIIATATGTVAYLVSLPFTILGGDSEEVGRKLVKAPALHTFKRPLGE
jgi:hypothetical protein